MVDLQKTGCGGMSSLSSRTQARGPQQGIHMTGRLLAYGPGRAPW